MEFKWPLDAEGNRKEIPAFSNLEIARYQVHMARVESTGLDGRRYIMAEVLYLQGWYVYFEALTRLGEFDPEVLKYLGLEINRLFKERYGWH